MSVSRGLRILWAKLDELSSLRLLYFGVAHAPRLILHVASIAAVAGLFSACVPATRYEEAKSSSDVQLAGRERAEAELRSTREKLAAAEAELARREQRLAQTEQSVSEVKLESTVLVKERDEATGLVEQLRGELARVGENLRTYAEQKAELEKSLQAAQARKLELEQNEAHAAEMARFTRDLTSVLGDRVTSGDVALDVRNGRIWVSVAPELCFDDRGVARPTSNALLASVSRVLVLHPETTVELGMPAPDAEARGTAWLDGLVSRGVAASRAKLVPAESQLELAFSVD